MNVTLICVIVTMPLSMSKVAANIGTSVCHCMTFAGFADTDETTRRVSIPSTMSVRLPGT